jgi:hypothetical protein
MVVEMWLLAFPAAAISSTICPKIAVQYIGKHNIPLQMQYLKQMGQANHSWIPQIPWQPAADGASKPFNKSFMDSSNTLAACSARGKIHHPFAKSFMNSSKS